jgi:hypothetical protein
LPRALDHPHSDLLAHEHPGPHHRTGDFSLMFNHGFTGRRTPKRGDIAQFLIRERVRVSDSAEFSQGEVLATSMQSKKAPKDAYTPDEPLAFQGETLEVGLVREK